MNADEKAQKILIEGRLLVERVDPRSGLIVASCRGFSGAIYKLGFDPTMPPKSTRAWRCTCTASATFSRRCSHLRALMLVTVRPVESSSGNPGETSADQETEG